MWKVLLAKGQPNAGPPTQAPPVWSARASGSDVSASLSTTNAPFEREVEWIVRPRAKYSEKLPVDFDGEYRLMAI